MEDSKRDIPEDEELAKCPWCKSVAEVATMPVNGSKHFYVRCVGGSVNCRVCPSTDYNTNRKTVVDEWNKCLS